MRNGQGRKRSIASSGLATRASSPDSPPTLNSARWFPWVTAMLGDHDPARLPGFWRPSVMTTPRAGQTSTGPPRSCCRRSECRRRRSCGSGWDHEAARHGRFLDSRRTWQTLKRWGTIRLNSDDHPPMLSQRDQVESIPSGSAAMSAGSGIPWIAGHKPWHDLRMSTETPEPTYVSRVHVVRERGAVSARVPSGRDRAGCV